MEDFIQIIFILIFIIGSIISSRNKKKKKQQLEMTKSVPVANKPVAVNKKQKSSAEILEEILGLKIEKPEPQQHEVPTFQSNKYQVPYQERNDTWDPSSEYEETSEDGTSNYRDKTEAKKTEFLEDKKKHKAFREEKIRDKKKSRSDRFTNLFSNKNDLKKYIIIQEVLNKPKALRR